MTDLNALIERPLTRAQFITQMILAYARVYPGTKAKEAMPIAATIYRDFIKGEGIGFGDARYAWDASAAATLVAEYEGVDLSAALSARTRTARGKSGAEDHSIQKAGIDTEQSVTKPSPATGGDA